MCGDCCNKLPNHIKFELWRPMAEGFKDVLKDAHLFLTNLGMKLDIIEYPKAAEQKDEELWGDLKDLY